MTVTMRVRFLYILLVLLAANNAFAQQADTVIKSNTIEIIQAYKPEVKQNPKPELSPNIPPVDTSHPVFNYVVPQQMLYYTYSSLPLRPLALGKDSSRPQYANYVKLGGGNLSTLYLDAGIGSLCGKNYETAIHAHSISQQGNIKYQQTSLTDLLAEGTLHANDKAWHASVAALRDQYYYYGYNHDLYQYNKDSLRQVFTGIHFGIDMMNELPNSSGINYHPAITASIYNDNFKASESTFGVALPFSYDVDTALQLRVAVNGTFTQLKVASASNNNNILQLAPGIVYHKGAFSGHAYLDPTFGKDNNYLLPDIAASYRLSHSLIAISAGWQALLHQNTYQDLTTENPYIYNTYTIQQNRTDEIYGNVSGSIGHHITLSGRLGWWQFSNLPVFINNPVDQKQFAVAYDNNLNAISFAIDARYQVNHTFAVGINSTWYNFNNGSQAKAWNVPGLRMKGDLIFKPLQQLTVTAYLSVLDNIYALNSNGQSVRVGGVFDVGGNAEYTIIPRLGLFVQVNNLLNGKNERWLGYTGYGFNIFGGIRFKF